MRRLICVGFTFLLLVIPLTAWAHPLGNFTTNQYLGIHVSGTVLVIDYVVDLAEIPASQQLRKMDADTDGEFTDTEESTFATTECRRATEEVIVTLGGDQLDLEVVATVMDLPEGEAGLPTLRLECRFLAATDLKANSTLSVTNANFPDRVGWNEMVLTTADVAATTDLPTASTTERLTSYPADGLLSPIDTRAGTAVLSPQPGVVRGEEPPAPGTGTDASRSPVDALAALIDPSQGSRTVPIAMAVAFGLGILHALSPGHGKTVMAAYLVGSRGTVAQAIGLGVAVAVSHTVGVLALGLVTLLGTSAFAPERTIPILTVTSGAIVTGIGAWMLLRWLRHRGTNHDADHHSHHHQDGDHGHSHGAHSHEIPAGLEGKAGWKILATMGLAGGLVPSTSAIVLLLAAVNLGRVPLGVLLIALFGLGMAATLVGVGFALVSASRFGTDRFGGAAWMASAQRVLTPVAALIVMTVGAVLTINAL